MLPAENLILVCAGADAAAAAAHKLPLLQFCLRVGAHGALHRLMLPARTEGCMLGLTDGGIDAPLISGTAENIVYEIRRLGMKGCFADFERDDPAIQTLTSALDRSLHALELPFFVPLVRGGDTEFAYPVAETAISGGDLGDYLAEQRAHFGGRLAVSLRPISTDFTLPSPDSEGQPLTVQERIALQTRTGAQAYFSRELCAKYFTYMSTDNTGHFVLFDDPSTLEAKLHLLRQMHIPYVFALYPDVSTLL